MIFDATVEDTVETGDTVEAMAASCCFDEPYGLSVAGDCDRRKGLNNGPWDC